MLAMAVDVNIDNLVIMGGYAGLSLLTLMSAVETKIDILKSKTTISGRSNK